MESWAAKINNQGNPEETENVSIHIGMAKSEQRKQYLREYRSRVCESCGGSKEVAGYCRSCWAKRTERRKQLTTEKKSRGECITCTNLVAQGKAKCDSCQAKARQQRTAREAKRKEQGLCLLCGKCESKGSSNRCEQCFCKEIASWHFKEAARWRDIYDVFIEQKGKCPFTKQSLVLGHNASLDHKLPKSRGGSDEKENLQWVYSDGVVNINTMKWNMTDKEFLNTITLIAEARHAH